MLQRANDEMERYGSVSYTHLDVYKRQVASRFLPIWYCFLSVCVRQQYWRNRLVWSWAKRAVSCLLYTSSTIENIPEYVLDNRHGDCGQVSLLFITLCRISGIPDVYKRQAVAFGMQCTAVAFCGDHRSGTCCKSG